MPESLGQSLQAAVKSWRVGAVTLLSMSSGMPLGLVLIALPTWLASQGVSIKTIGLLGLTQAPYAFKFLWAPLLDRFRPLRMGRKRGWIFLSQIALASLTGLLVARATQPSVGLITTVAFFIALVSSTQDIAIDAYAVESLLPSEQGVAVGARTAMYRLGMWLAGNIAISVVPWMGWGVTLGLQALLYLLFLPVTFFSPEPALTERPVASLKEAVWDPFVGFFLQPRALEIAAFILLYKLADNLATSLIRPFFVQLGFGALDVGIASGTIGLIGMMGGTFVGGLLTQKIGTGRALWIFGVAQAVANLGYAALAHVGPHRGLMYAAMALETGASGLGTGAFGVLLLQLTQKRFSATQYALFSSLFALGRTLAGPIAGTLVDAIGWKWFFIFTVPCGIPGLVMLHRFVPWGAELHLRDDDATQPDDESSALDPKNHRALVQAAGLGGIASALALFSFQLGLSWLKTAQLQWKPTLVGAVALVGAGLIGGLATAAHAYTHRRQPIR